MHSENSNSYLQQEGSEQFEGNIVPLWDGLSQRGIKETDPENMWGEKYLLSNYVFASTMPPLTVCLFICTSQNFHVSRRKYKKYVCVENWRSLNTFNYATA